MTNVNKRLRLATAAHHHALDHHPLLQRLVRKGLMVEEYRSSLAAMHAVHAALECCVLNSEWHEKSGLQLQPRSYLLRNDIETLGGAPCELAGAWFRCAASESEWLGQAYVLEGSRQGSAVIVERVVGSLGESIPRRFFSASGDQDAWSHLLFRMEAQLNTSRQVAIATEAAQVTFEDYRRAIDSTIKGADSGLRVCCQ